MPRTVNLQARIMDDGKVFICGATGSRETSGLYHLLEPTEPLLHVLTHVLEMNDKAAAADPVVGPTPGPYIGFTR